MRTGALHYLELQPGFHSVSHPSPPQPCPVCLCKLSEASDYQSEDLGLDLVKLLKCSHRLHRLCFQHYFASQTSRDSPVSLGGEWQGVEGSWGGVGATASGRGWKGVGEGLELLLVARGEGVMSRVVPSAVWHPLPNLQEDTWGQGWRYAQRVWLHACKTDPLLPSGLRGTRLH